MKLKRLLVLATSLMLLCTAVACTPTVTPTDEPTATLTPAPTPEDSGAPVSERSVVREAIPGAVEYSSETDGGITYSVAKYSKPVAATYRYGGTNLALSKPVTASGSYGALNPAAVTDGNLSNLWGSDSAGGDWIQIDLGESVTIGRVELRSRVDYDSPSERNLFQILLSNDETFATYDVMYEQGYQPYPYLNWFVINNPLPGSYRYVRMQRNKRVGHFCLSEMCVYDTKADLLPEEPIEYAPAGSQMIVSRSGKALSLCGDAAVAASYAFKNSQRWTVENVDGGIKLRSVTDGRYLALVDGRLMLTDGAGSVFTVTEDESIWSRLSVEGRAVVSHNGELALADKADPGDVYERWAILEAYTHDLPKGDTSWMLNGYGVMYHLLPTSSSYRSLAKRFDCAAVADSLKAVGADYFMLSVGQSTGYYNTYNSVYASIVSFNGQKRFTNEDILSKMADELAARDMKLMVYATAGPSTNDMEDFGYTKSHTDESAMLWSLCLREWSLAYGDKAVGWWIDGGYSGTVNQIQELMMANGIKAGNPNTAVSFNAGIIVAENSVYDEFTCGETDFPFGSDTVLTDRTTWLTPQSDPVKTQQWFELTFLNVGWCFNKQPRAGIYDKALWAEYVKTVLDQGGGICLDVTYDTTSYLMIDEMSEILRAVDASVHGK